MPAVATSAPPPLVSRSGLFGIGHAREFLKQPLALLQRGYQEHGRAFTLKLGPTPMAVLLGPKHSQFVFQETDKRLSIRHGYPFFGRMFSDRLYFLARAQEYQAQRNFVVPMFRGRQLESYVPTMVEEIEQLLDGLGDAGELELVETFGTLVMNIAIHCFLGRDFRERLGDRFFHTFRDFSSGMDPVLPTWLPLPHILRSNKARARLHATLQAVIDERRALKDPPNDFLQKLLDGAYLGGSMPDSVIIDIILLFSWAGHETTAGHTSWAIADLLQHPGYLARVIEEQEAIFADTQATGLDMTHVRQFTLLERALKETERIHPVAFILMRKATEDIEVEDLFLKKGTLVTLCPWLTHRLPELYTNPESWDPDRFGPERGERMRHLIGFGGGIHKCAGINFAYLEMKVILSLLLRRYELELLDEPQPVRGSHTKWPDSPCRIRYRRRVPAVVTGESR